MSPTYQDLSQSDRPDSLAIHTLKRKDYKVILNTEFMKSYFWSGICYNNRLKAIAEITGIADRYATILNFQRFSDISLSLILDLEAGNLTNLKNGLSDIMSMDCADIDLDGSEPECIVLLNITFTKGTGNMKIEVPDIPG